MKEQQQHYELALIISGSTGEEKHPQILASIQNLLTKSGAQNIASAALGRKKLAYAIKNIKHGFYFTCEFNVLPNVLKNINGELKLNNDLLRYLIVRKSIKSEADILKETKRKEGKVKAQIKKEAVIVKAAKEATKMSLEDLDKKLDEILEEKII